MLLGYDYHNGNTYKHGNSNLLWRLDKDSLANQSAIFLIIRATDICCNQVVCKWMAGNKGILLKENGQLLFLAVRFKIFSHFDDPVPTDKKRPIRVLMFFRGQINYILLVGGFHHNLFE